MREGEKERGTMLEVRGLTLGVEGRTLLSDVTMHIATGETVALFGPNGSGKTSLLNAIIGMPGYRVVSGSVIFKGQDVTALPMDERARLGMGISFQRPPAVRGVRLGELVRICMEARGGYDESLAGGFAHLLNLEGFLQRDVNLGFSGGEIKRSELLQLLAQAPDLVMFDEPDSGVDLVSITRVGEVMNALLEKSRPAGARTKAGLVISHAGHILDYVNADRAYVLLDGSLYCSGNPRDLLDDIRHRGYEGCVKCKI
jgi:Fe-S cluster assembly ATP-binding protein